MPQDFVIFGMSISAILGGLLAAGMIIVIGVILLISLMFLLFYSFTLTIGAKIVDIKDRTFGKALTATFLYIFIASIPCTILFFIAWPLGIIAFLVTPCFIVKWIYECSLSQAFLASISSLVVSFAMIIAFIIGMVYLIKGTFDQKKTADVEKITKVEIKETPILPTPEVEINDKSISKTLIKEPMKLNAIPKRGIQTKAPNKIKQIKPMVSRKKKSKVIVAESPKTKLKTIDKKSTIKLAKK